jgi:prepilin-type N-terminal cleavage/methylation domain
MQHRRYHGFTLLELMITVAVVAILASVAYPSYIAHIQSARREEAKKALLEAAQKMESYYAMNLKYTGATDAQGNSTIFPTQAPATGTANYYIKITAASTTSYTLTAQRNTSGSQAKDPCGNMVLNRDGTKSVTNATYTADQCW